MADSTKYFQLTPEILVEYNYNDINSVNNQNGEAKHIIDFGEDKFKAMVVQNGFCSTNTFLLPQDIIANENTNATAKNTLVFINQFFFIFHF